MNERAPTPGILLAPSVDQRVEAQARDAFRELWDRVVTKADAGSGSRWLTRAMVKDAIDARLRDFLGPGVRAPRVEVRVNVDGTGFDIDIQPASMRISVTEAAYGTRPASGVLVRK